MEISKIILALALAAAPLSADTEGRIFYLIRAGSHKEAIALYQEEYAQNKRHNFELLQKIGIGILEQGHGSKDPEVQILTLFGAAISLNEQVSYILEEGVKNTNPQIQLAALSLLSKNQSDAAEEVLLHAVSSPFLPIRLEAVLGLALRKHPLAVIQAESLMYKLPKAVQPLFPQIFAMVGNEQSMKLLRKMLSSSSDAVRIAAIVSSAKYGRDDMLPQIRLLASHFNVPQQEACAYALGAMKDEASASKLEQLSLSSHATVSLAALQALYRLGRVDTRRQVETMALEDEDLFAIGVLGEMPGSEETLLKLMQNPAMAVRINAALALLDRNHPACLRGLVEFFVRDARDLAFAESQSPGKAFSSVKVLSSASQTLQDTPIVFELSTALRESALIKTRELPEQSFLALADLLFVREQSDLIPTLVRLLEDLKSPGAIALLKKHQQKLGAPLIRHYCNLALYRLKVPGPYAENLRQWVKGKSDLDMISFRPLVPWEMRSNMNNYQLTPKEESRLLVEAFEAFGAQQDERGIEALVEAIQNGNAKNKYALAGLLILATQ